MLAFLVDLPLMQVVLAFGLIIATLFYLVVLYSAHEFFRARRAVSDAGLPEPVTILKPLKGMDVGLYENLRSLCRQEYPSFQLITGVADPQDPAVAVVQRLQRDYPEHNIELVVDERVYGTNRKISNLYNMYARAKHDIIVFADSDIRVEPNYLRRLVTALHDGVGLVTCPYRAVTSGGVPSLIESLFINTDFFALVMAARKIERSTYAFGSTIAVRRRVLEEVGGFLPLANYLADDYQLGHQIAARGYRLALSSMTVDTIIAVDTWRQLLTHQLRWARTYRICRPVGYFASILTHGTSWALANVLYHQFSPLSCALSLGVIGLRYVGAATLSWRYLRTNLRPAELLLIVPKDLLVTLMWLLAFLGTAVRWSGRRFRVRPDGAMEDLTRGAPLPGTLWPRADIPNVSPRTDRTARSRSVD